MATTLKLVYGASTVDLYNGTSMQVMDYTPAADTTGVPVVTESARVTVIGTSAAHLAAERNKITQVAQAVELYKRSGGVSDRPFVQFQPDGMGYEYRAQLTDFIPAPDAETYYRRWATPFHTYMTLAWTRENAWESVTETTATLSNAHGTATTGTIYNTWDGTAIRYNNWVQIGSADVGGDLPAAARLLYANKHAAAVGNLWVGHNYTSGTVGMIYEAESAAYTSGTGIGEGTIFSGTAYVDYSGSAGVQIKLASTEISDLFTWTVGSADLTAYKGQWFKSMLRYGTAYDLPYARYRLLLGPVGTPEYTTTWTQQPEGTLQLLDIASFRLPPAVIGGLSSAGTIGITLQGYLSYDEAGLNLGQVCKYDFLYLMPMDGYRQIEFTVPLSENDRVVDDGIIGQTYIDNGAGLSQRSGAIGAGDQIQLQPGKLQRLYFLAQSNTGAALIEDDATVQVVFRERRLML